MSGLSPAGYPVPSPPTAFSPTQIRKPRCRFRHHVANIRISSRFEIFYRNRSIVMATSVT
ncbi:hypothetical protein D3OALGA1CA_4886 [Olavius algarvensis associated proteobacterium Delta 3]|nr:hypothetical protein D3OALGB2SA_51 [Olavius algarvensis associated proteobacterium Delta 3]CAB5158367.1 hypothetical protein D3OALGA1CA_4886 [Olavius algarvensis associated proteobacterium Delta 3]